jgi:hypothetical protein
MADSSQETQYGGQEKHDCGRGKQESEESTLKSRWHLINEQIKMADSL